MPDMDYDQPYKPTPAELAVVGELQRQGAPMQVGFFAQESLWFPSWTTHVIRFTGNGKTYDAESWRLVAWPQISFVEMQALGMIQKAAK